MTFERTSTQYATFEWRYDSAGNVWVQAQAHDTLVAKTPYFVINNEFGQISSAQSDVTIYCLVGVAPAAAASADIDWLQIGGYCASMITPALTVSAGHALSIDGGVVADVAADYTGASSEFAVNVTLTAGGTTCNAMLVPRYILTTT